jgi:hypothetical protein
MTSFGYTWTSVKRVPPLAVVRWPKPSQSSNNSTPARSTGTISWTSRPAASCADTAMTSANSVPVE